MLFMKALMVFVKKKKLDFGAETGKSVEDRHGLMNEKLMLPFLEIVTVGMRY